MKSKYDRRNYIIIGLCAILVVMGVGYAAFSSLLTINGTANISNSWCLGFDNTKTNTYQITKGVSTGQAPTGTMTYTGTACSTTLVPHSNLTAAFHQPGDQIEYTLTIKNASTVTAAIKSIKVDNQTITSNTTKTKGNITFTVNFPLDTTLSPNEETTMTVVAKFQNETDVTGSYAGNESQSISVELNGEQDDGNGGIVPTPSTFTGTIYRWNTNIASVGDSIVSVSATKWCPNKNGYNGCEDSWYFDTEAECNANIQEGVSQGWYQQGEYTCQQRTVTTGGVGEYTTDASTLNKTYYLKHTVVNDIITNSYVCVVYNNTEHCMKGGDGGESFASNTQMIQDYQTFYSLGEFNEDWSNPQGCIFNSNVSVCSGGDFYQIRAEFNGYVEIYGSVSSNERCTIYDAGDSQCLE